MAAKQSLRKIMDEEKVKGFVDVLVANDIADGLSHLLVYARYTQESVNLYLHVPILIYCILYYKYEIVY